MKQISNYITEKLKITKDIVASKLLPIDTSSVKDRNAVFTDSEIHEILMYATDNLPKQPHRIKMLRTGNIQLQYRLKVSSSELLRITFKKPEGYNNSWKVECKWWDRWEIRCDNPGGGTLSLDKNGKPMYPDCKSSFAMLNKVWVKRKFNDIIKDDD